MTRHTEHHLPVRVYYEDTDAAGIVYHASYVRFAERGRTEMLRDAGYEHATLLKEQGIAFAVVSMQIDFKAPGKLDEELTVASKVTKLGGASMHLLQTVRRGTEDLCAMKVALVCIDKNMKAVRLPDEVREIFKNV
ncbi:MAG: tol-pal system-associated acyl-CoA thioesterase [Alphaproteobacteria bacterium]|nr:tol-pal system-associated acyl-CoA thioesterase [Alphaproteobacteria bacterium]